MSTIREEISTFRGLIKEISDDSKYTDSFIYSIWSRARGRVLRGKDNWDNWNHIDFCIRLIMEKVDENCDDCDEDDCKALRTECKIPRPIRGRDHQKMQVTTRDGKLIPEREPWEINTIKTDPMKRNTIFYVLHNGYFYIHNTIKLRMIYISSVPEDIVAWDKCRYCGDDDECEDIRDVDSGLSRAESEVAMKMALELMTIPFQRQEDITPDRNVETRL